MANLFTVPAGKLNAFTGMLAKAGLTAEIVMAVDTNPDIVQVMVDAAQKFVKEEINPFFQTLSEQIEALKVAIREEGWDIPAETIASLAETAPEWPKGRNSYRSFRIRFGEGDEGVAKTSEAHMARIKRVHGDAKFWRWDNLRSDKKHLRLLSGNATHTPVVEWTIVHLDADLMRDGTIRSLKSLADEGLVMAWLFPQRVQAIDYNMWPAWYCAGYELRVPEHGESWKNVLYIGFDHKSCQVCLGVTWHYPGHWVGPAPALGK